MENILTAEMPTIRNGIWQYGNWNGMAMWNVKRNDNVKYENDDKITFTSKPKVKIKGGELITLHML